VLEVISFSSDFTLFIGAYFKVKPPAAETDQANGKKREALRQGQNQEDQYIRSPGEQECAIG